MMLTKKKFEKLYREQKQREKWEDFYHADHVGYLIKYQGLTFECINSEHFFEKRACIYGMLYDHFIGINLTLKKENETIEVTILRETPIEIDFVYEDVNG